MFAAAIGGKALWYLTRGTGITALLLLTLSVVLGILEVKRWQSARWPRFVTAGLHRNVSLLSVAFVAVHVATTVVDGFAPIGWIDAVVPFHSPYRPLWLGLGAVAVDLLIALVVTSLLRGRLGYRTWRAVHWSAYGCWPVAVLHGLGTGTDVRLTWALGANGLAAAAVLAALWWRIADAWTTEPATPATRGAAGTALIASVMIPAAAVSWLVTGPLRPGWARRAGTPVSLRANPTPTPAAATGPATPGPAMPGTTTAAWALPSSTAFTGHVTQAGSAGGDATVTVSGSLNDRSGGSLVIVLEGRALPGGGVAMRTGRIAVGPPGSPATYSGPVSSLSGNRLTAGLSGPGGRTVSVVVTVRLAGSDVTGTFAQVAPGA